MDVEDGEVDRLFLAQRARRHGVLGGERRVALRGQILLQNLAQLGLVIDDEDGRPFAHVCPPHVPRPGRMKQMIQKSPLREIGLIHTLARLAHQIAR